MNSHKIFRKQNDFILPKINLQIYLRNKISSQDVIICIVASRLYILSIAYILEYIRLPFRV